MSNYIVPIGILIAAILIIAGGYILLNPEDKKAGVENKKDNENFTEKSESESYSFIPEIKVTADELKRNAPVPFKVGDKYKYKINRKITYPNIECKNEKDIPIVYKKMYNENYTGPSDLPAGCIIENKTITATSYAEFFVEKTEKAEGKDCYLISSKTTQEIPEEEKEEMRKSGMTDDEIEKQIKTEEKMMEEQKLFFYYDRETGKLIKVVMKMGNREATYTKDMAEAIEGFSMLGMGYSNMFSKWMLSLDKNFRWEQNIEDKKDKKHRAKIEYKVIDEEKINKRDCFKVELIFKDESITESKKTTMKATVWVDKEKRILVKSLANFEKLTTFETNLISEI